MDHFLPSFARLLAMQMMNRNSLLRCVLPLDQVRPDRAWCNCTVTTECHSGAQWADETRERNLIQHQHDPDRTWSVVTGPQVLSCKHGRRNFMNSIDLVPSYIIAPNCQRFSNQYCIFNRLYRPSASESLALKTGNDS